MLLWILAEEPGNVDVILYKKVCKVQLCFRIAFQSHLGSESIARQNFTEMLCS